MRDSGKLSPCSFPQSPYLSLLSNAESAHAHWQLRQRKGRGEEEGQPGHFLTCNPVKWLTGPQHHQHMLTGDWSKERGGVKEGSLATCSLATQWNGWRVHSTISTCSLATEAKQGRKGRGEEEGQPGHLLTCNPMKWLTDPRLPHYLAVPLSGQ